MWLLSVIVTGAHAQTGSKPKQFSQFPDVITCTEAQLSRIFDAAVGQTVQLSFSDNFSFDGPVINNVVRYSNLQSAVIKSPAFHNSIFSVSRITNSDNSITYVGRILNRERIDKTVEGIYFVCAVCKKVCHNLDEGLVEDPDNVKNMCDPCAPKKGDNGKESKGGRAA